MGFTGNIGLEAAALGKALLVGAALGIYYDLFRILRRVFHFGYAMILGQDLLFWLTSAVGVFFGSVVVYEGQLRILFALAALAGWGIYTATAGALVMTVVDFVLSILRRVCGLIYRHTFLPLSEQLKSAANKTKCNLKARKIKLFADFRKKRGKYAKNRKISA